MTIYLQILSLDGKQIDYLVPHCIGAWIILKHPIQNYCVGGPKIRLIPQFLDIGNGSYKINADSDKRWNNPSEILNQIDLTRSYKTFKAMLFLVLNHS
jgi:hypothetical protein